MSERVSRWDLSVVTVPQASRAISLVGRGITLKQTMKTGRQYGTPTPTTTRVTHTHCGLLCVSVFRLSVRRKNEKETKLARVLYAYSAARCAVSEVE